MSTWRDYQQQEAHCSRITHQKLTFESNSQIRYQQKSSHISDKRPGLFKCPNCGKGYRWLRNMKNHVKVECGKDPKECCPYCPHRTKYKSSLQKHIVRIHFS